MKMSVSSSMGSMARLLLTWPLQIVTPTEDKTMRSIVILGAAVALIGLIAFAVPAFNTEQTRNVVDLGDLKVQAKTQETHVIPPIVSEGAIVLGVLLIGAGLVMSGRTN
jgi:hypothetical protein